MISKAPKTVDFKLFLGLFFLYFTPSHPSVPKLADNFYGNRNKKSRSRRPAVAGGTALETNVNLFQKYYS
jgi:hypothetical protein